MISYKEKVCAEFWFSIKYMPKGKGDVLAVDKKEVGGQKR